MNMNKPSTQQIVAGVGMLLAFLGTFFTWWSLDIPKGTPAFGFDVSASGTDYTKGVFVLILALLAIALLVLSLMPSLFPENIQMALLGAPLVQLGLGALAFLLTFIGLFSSGMGGLDASRGFGLWLCLIGTLVWLVVTALQSKEILAMAQAMKAGQQTPPPPAPPAPPTV